MPRGLLAVVIVLTVLLAALVQAEEARAAHFGYRSLARGARGEDVEELQWMLRCLGYYRGPVDGVFGTELEKCVKGLQKLYKLPQTGKLEGRMLEIARTIWSAFVSGEFDAFSVNPNHLKKESGRIQLVVYTVCKGDTLSSIARRYNAVPSALVRLNRLSNPDLIKAGQTLFVVTYR